MLFQIFRQDIYIYYGTRSQVMHKVKVVTRKLILINTFQNYVGIKMFIRMMNNKVLGKLKHFSYKSSKHY